MPPAGFEPATSASERPQTLALDREANAIDLSRYYYDPVAVDVKRKLRTAGNYCQICNTLTVYAVTDSNKYHSPDNNLL